MIFTRADLEVESIGELASFALVLPFVALVLPFLLSAYTLGWLLDQVGWLDT